MKKIFASILFSLACICSFGQVTDNFFGLRTWQANGYHFTINGTSGTDSLFSQYESYLKLFKGLLPGSYTTGTLPSGMPAGTIILNTDSISSLKLAMYNGTGWGYLGGSTPGGGATPTLQQVITQGNALTKSDTIALAGFNWDFYTGSRGRNLLINSSDSLVHFQNFGAEFQPDSLTESSNGYYLWYAKSGSANPLNSDLSWGRYIAPQSGQAATEITTTGFNLLPSGVQRIGTLPAMGVYHQYNLYAGSAYHNIYAIRAITSAGTVIDIFRSDHTLSNNAINNSILSSSLNLVNPANQATTWAPYANFQQNTTTLYGASPKLVLEDTAFTAFGATIQVNSKDLTISSGRNLITNAGPNGTTINSGYIYMNSPLNAFNVPSPTAQLQIGASSGSSQTAPIKFTLLHSKPMSSPEKGALEVDSSGRLFMTDSSSHRDTIAKQSWVEANFAPIGSIPSGGTLSGNAEVVTNGASFGITVGANEIVIDPSSITATQVITLPVSPPDGTIVNLHFGGTLTSGTIVTSFSVVPGSGAAIIDNSAPTTAVYGDYFRYHYYTTNLGSPRWYREH